MKKRFLLAGIFGVAFIWLAAMLLSFDVAPTGLNDEKIGLSSINFAVRNAVGPFKIWDSITDGCVVLAILLALGLGVLGVIQLVKRKKFAKVDNELLCVAGLYAVMGVFYVLFEKLAVNCRPVFEDDGSLEASFPSTHTLISCVVLWSGAILLGKYVKNKNSRVILQTACIVLSLVASLGRLLAGVHWFTDVLGGYLLSAALVFAFWGVLKKLQQKD